MLQPLNVLSTQPVTILGPVQVWASEEDSVCRSTGFHCSDEVLEDPRDPRGCPGCRGYFYSAQIPNAWMIVRDT